MVAAAAARVANGGPQEPLDLSACRHFVNLTNGLEALPMLHDLGLPYSFCRLQSTACEQQNLEALVAELDAGLLTSLALGHCCLVYDCGSRRRDGTPRALWYGLEFVRYTLSKLWLRRPCPALLRGKNVASQFDAHIRAFRQPTLRRLQYYAKFIPHPPAAAPAPPPAPSSALACAASAAATPPQPQAEQPLLLPYGVRLHGVFRGTDRDAHGGAFQVALLHTHHLPPPPPPPPPPQQQQQQQQQQQRAGAAGDARPARASAAGADGDNGEAAAALSVTASSSSSSSSSGVAGAPFATLPQAAAALGPSGSVQEGAEGGGGSVSGGGAAMRTFGGGGEVVGVDGGEAMLARYGFRVFWRGLSPAEWAAASAAAATDAADASGPGLG